MWIVIVNSCEDCGNDMSVKLFEQKPSNDQIYEVEVGMGCCSRTYTSEISMNKILEVETG